MGGISGEKAVKNGFSQLWVFNDSRRSELS
jgi:hypothetical protein